MAKYNIKLKKYCNGSYNTSSQKITSEVKRMTETNLEYTQIEVKGFQDLCKHLAEVEARNEFLERCVNALKLNMAQLTKERNDFCKKNIELSKELHDIKQMSMFEFGNTYCSDESLEADGKAFARALGVGVRMTDDEVAIAKAEDNYVPYTAEDF